MWNFTSSHSNPQQVLPYLGGVSPCYLIYPLSGGNGSFSSPIPRNNISNPASQQISSSVVLKIQHPSPVVTPTPQDPYPKCEKSDSHNAHHSLTEKQLSFEYLFRNLLQAKGVFKLVNPEFPQFQSLPLNEQLHYFVSSQLMADDEIRIRRELASEIYEILRSHYPKCQIYVFGSFLTGLGDSNSDLDVYVDIKGDGGISFQPSRTRLQEIRAVRNDVHKILKSSKALHTRNPSRFTLDIRQLGKRVPYLRFIHKPSKLSCDLSVGSRLPVQNSKLLIFYLNYDQRIRPFIVFLRYWAKFHKIAGEMDIKQYAISLLAIVYLTRKKIIPSIQLLQTLEAEKRANNGDHENPDEIDGWDASFCEDLEVINERFPERFVCSPEEYSKDSGRILVEMALGFFGMVGNWDFNSTVICPLSGNVVPKSVFLEEKETEAVKALERMEVEQFEHNRPFCLQDPFVLNFNVGRVVKPEIIEKFQSACSYTFQKLWPVKERITSLLDLFEELPKKANIHE